MILVHTLSTSLLKSAGGSADLRRWDRGPEGYELQIDDVPRRKVNFLGMRKVFIRDHRMRRDISSSYGECESSCVMSVLSTLLDYHQSVLHRSISPKKTPCLLWRVMRARHPFSGNDIGIAPKWWQNLLMCSHTLIVRELPHGAQPQSFCSMAVEHINHYH